MQLRNLIAGSAKAADEFIEGLEFALARIPEIGALLTTDDPPVWFIPTVHVDRITPLTVNYTFDAERVSYCRSKLLLALIIKWAIMGSITKPIRRSCFNVSSGLFAVSLRCRKGKSKLKRFAGVRTGKHRRRNTQADDSATLPAFLPWLSDRLLGQLASNFLVGQAFVHNGSFVENVRRL
jgi:hypothetical protein